MKQPKSEPAWLPNIDEFVVNKAEADEASPRRATVVAKDFIVVLAPRQSSLEWSTRIRVKISGRQSPAHPSAHQAHIPLACGFRCN